MDQVYLPRLLQKSFQLDPKCWPIDKVEVQSLHKAMIVHNNTLGFFMKQCWFMVSILMLLKNNDQLQVV